LPAIDTPLCGAARVSFLRGERFMAEIKPNRPRFAPLGHGVFTTNLDPCPVFSRQKAPNRREWGFQAKGVFNE
jgi:hypothetical protein